MFEIAEKRIYITLVFLHRWFLHAVLDWRCLHFCFLLFMNDEENNKILFQHRNSSHSFISMLVLILIFLSICLCLQTVHRDCVPSQFENLIPNRFLVQQSIILFLLCSSVQFSSVVSPPYTSLYQAIRLVMQDMIFCFNFCGLSMCSLTFSSHTSSLQKWSKHIVSTRHTKEFWIRIWKLLFF